MATVRVKGLNGSCICSLSVRCSL